MSGRIRTIKPEWLEDERMGMATLEARVMSIALILLADDYGNGRASPAMLISVFPLAKDPRASVAGALAELVAMRFLVLYQRDGQSYFAIRNWAKHQRVSHPGAPRVPEPSAEEMTIPETLARTSGESPEILRPDLGRGRGRGTGPDPDRSARAKTWRRFPADWVPTPEHMKLATELRVSLDGELAKIRDFEFSRPRSDPDATFRTWLRTAAERSAPRAVPPGLVQHRANGGRGDEGPPPARPENRQLPDRKVERVAPGDGAALARSAITTVLRGKAPL